VAPNGMEFGLDEYAGVLPDRPADYAFSARLRHPPFYDVETFADWLAWCGLDDYLDGRLPGGDLPAEFSEVLGR